MEDGWSEVDKMRILDFRSSLEGWRAGNENVVETMRAILFGILRWAMFVNDKGGFIGIFGEARLGRKKAVLAPSIEHEISAFLGEGVMEDFVATIDSVYDRLAVARIF